MGGLAHFVVSSAQNGFDLKVAAGLIPQIPWLRVELQKMLNDVIAKEVCWL